MTTTAADTTRRPAAKVATTLGEELRFFCAQTNPRLMAAVVVLTLAGRLAVGSYGMSDAVAVAALLGVQPFFEWAFHVYVLHYRPIVVLGRTIDFELARKHREHHADPTAVALIFVPLRSLVVAMVVVAVLALALAPTTALALTVMTGGAALLLAYEWTHYLIHSRYRPKTRLYRALWRAHRLHHYKNEQYWFGVTNPTADHLLGTSPDPGAVPTSPTARNLNAG
jgi:sterol desaturase/sphingolipid hydroxylase (fatty acid hydroxylase superfamily)